MTIIYPKNWENREGSDYWTKERVETYLENSKNSPLILLDGLKLKDNYRIAEIGCGVGRRSGHFERFSEYVGFDREDNMLEAARKKFPDFYFKKCDCQEILDKYPEYIDYFDLVFSFHCLMYNHILQQKEIFCNMYKMLHVGGFLYIKEGTVYKCNDHHGYTDLMDLRSLNGSIFTEKGWINFITNFGFKFVATDGVDGHFLFVKE